MSESVLRVLPARLLPLRSLKTLRISLYYDTIFILLLLMPVNICNLLCSNSQREQSSHTEPCHAPQASFTSDNVLCLLKRTAVLPRKQNKNESGQHSKHSNLRAIFFFCRQVVAKTNPQDNFALSEVVAPNFPY